MIKYKKLSTVNRLQKLSIIPSNIKGAEMRAQEAIDQIKSVKTKFMGHTVKKHNYAIDIRSELQKMAENNEISPLELWKSLRLTWPKMSKSEKGAEFDNLI